MLPETGVKPERPRVRVGHRLRGPLPVLHDGQGMNSRLDEIQAAILRVGLGGSTS